MIRDLTDGPLANQIAQTQAGAARMAANNARMVQAQFNADRAFAADERRYAESQGRHADSMALAYAEMEQKRDLAEAQLDAQELRRDRTRRGTVARNAARGATMAAKVGQAYDVEGFQNMVADLRSSDAHRSQIDAMLHQFGDLEYPTEEEFVSSPEFGELFGATAELYGMLQTEQSQARKGESLVAFSQFVGDERYGVQEADVAKLNAMAADPGVSFEDFLFHRTELKDQLASRFAFTESKRLAQAEADQLWAEMRKEHASNRSKEDFEAMLLGGEEGDHMDDLYRLYGRVGLAEDPQELARARGNFLIKAHGLDGVVTEAEDAAYRAGMEAVRDRFTSADAAARFQVDGAPPAQLGQAPEAFEPQSEMEALAQRAGIQVPPGLADAPFETQQLFGDLLRGGIDPTDTSAENVAAIEQFLAHERRVSPGYGLAGPDKAHALLKAGGNEHLTEAVDTLMDKAGMDAEEAIELAIRGEERRKTIKEGRREIKRDARRVGAYVPAEMDPQSDAAAEWYAAPEGQRDALTFKHRSKLRKQATKPSQVADFDVQMLAENARNVAIAFPEPEAQLSQLDALLEYEFPKMSPDERRNVLRRILTAPESVQDDARNDVLRRVGERGPGGLERALNAGML
ncbi:MAG: hypothetical protein AAFP22_07100 [Planctomycetota bacterium]